MVKYASLTTAALAIATAIAGAWIVLALFSSPDATDGSRALAFSVVQDQHGTLTPDSAFQTLKHQESSTTEKKTNRSEKPFWIMAETITDHKSGEGVIEFPSRHAQTVDYWIRDLSDNLIASGSATRSSTKFGSIKRTKAGFAIPLPKSDGIKKILIRVSASGPARITLAERSADQIEESNQNFNRSGGVLFGSLLMIAGFSILISLLSRDATFFLFAAWVISSLRLASYSSGWDLGWLGHPWMENHPVITRNIPLAAYAVFTVTLFWRIFKRDIVSLGAVKCIRLLISISLALVAIAIALPHRTFLPLLWMVVVPSVSILMWLNAKIFFKTGSTVAAWYAASWIAALVGALSEVAFAAGIITFRPTLLNSLTGSVISALLTGIALAQRINSEKSERISAQTKNVSLLTKFRENYNSMPVGLFSLDRNGFITLYNPSFAEMFGIQQNDNEHHPILIDSLLGPESRERIRKASERNGDNDLEIEVSYDSRGTKWFQARVLAKDDSIEGSIQDITTRKDAEGKLRHLVDHDSLTGMLNRRGLEEVMTQAKAAVQGGGACSIAHVDLDRFKLVNDLYGHSTGDLLLTNAAARLRNAVRGTDYVARIADSFVVVLMDCPDHAVVRLTERLRESIVENPFELDGRSLNMTVSIGVVALDQFMSPVDAMAAADRACAEAKSRGRNCVVRLNDQDSALRSHLEELKMVASLQRSAATDRYFLEFQPVVSLRTAFQSLSYEVLIRMRGEDGKIVPPGRFIGAAERNGLMSEIDRWVLRSTLEWLDAHPAHRDRLTFATINLSGASLNDVRFVEDAFSMIADHPLAMTKLCFEVTESVALHDVGSTRRFVERVRSYGSKVALDDFGAGYTSFNYLKEIPADFIKIDGSFVKDINQNPANYAITRTIVELTHELGMSSIAEWAETPDTVASLLELGVDYAQGFGLARPMARELVTQAASSGSLVRDPEVRALLNSGGVQLVSMHSSTGRRH